MITGLHGDRLGAWIAAVSTDDLPHLHTFANGLERITSLCWPGSPCPTHLALSKAKSARSNS